MTALSIAILSSIMGFLGAMVGVGGGTFLVPSMVFALDVSPIEAMPISLICALATAISGSILSPISSSVAKRALLFMPIAMLGVFLFTPLAFLLDSQKMLFSFSFFLFVIIFIFLFVEKKTLKPADIGVNKETICGCLTVFFSGVCAGLFGVGGGIIMVPLLSSFSSIPTKESMQISLLIMISTSILGLVLHESIGHVPWSLGLAAMMGAIPAGMLGGKIRVQISEKNLNKLFIVLALVMAAMNLIKGFSR